MTKKFVDEPKQSNMKFMKPVLYLPKLSMVDNFHEYKQKIGLPHRDTSDLAIHKAGKQRCKMEFIRLTGIPTLHDQLKYFITVTKLESN